MIYLAWIALGLALAIVAGMFVLVRFADDDDLDFEIDEELFEDDLRHELSDISFGRRQ